MTKYYTNLPPTISNNNFGNRAFVNFFTETLEVDGATLDAMTGFFTSKEFDEISSASLASVLIFQANKDGINPLALIDTLKGLTNLELNSLIAEIINYNRYKTSYLGFGPIFIPNLEISRTILS